MVYAYVPADTISKALPCNKEMVTEVQDDIRAEIVAFIKSITLNDETAQYL
jgi:hypothetical protein